MSNTAPFGPIAELLERSLSIRHVYGEPVQHGDTTVIPVAKVAYGFGGGGGQGPGRGRTYVAEDRVIAANSELRELWEETEEVSAWLAAMAELRGRLTAPVS